MEPPLPSVTSTWHNNTYPAISPSRHELSAAGKTVIIIGAGSGIGRETAFAFASAGANKLVLLGRSESSLKETKDSLLLSSINCSIHAVSVTDEKGLKNVAASAGVWDILILNSGYLSTPASISDSSIEDWWQSFETNVKGSFIASHIFLPTANPTHSTILGVTSGTISLPSAMTPGISAYQSSKIAQVKMLEFLAAENPRTFVASVHPGMVDTVVFRKSGARAEDLPMDTVQLPAHFMVWMASPEAAFLKGRLVWANWDVDELKAQAREIESSQRMLSGNIGWPYTPVG